MNQNFHSNPARRGVKYGTRKMRSFFFNTSLTAGLILGLSPFTSAQIQVDRAFPVQLAVKKQEKEDKQKKEEGRESGDENKFPHGGSVSTSPDVDRIMAKAARYQKEDNYRAASRFWLAALERAPGKMFSTDNVTYFPLVQHIEAKLAKLPPEGMKVYRIAADAQAEEILAAGKDDDPVVTLQKVVDVAFLSSKGDDCALKLAGLYLDRFQAPEAEALLLRIINVYPDSDLSMDQVWLKLAIAKYLNGDVDEAKKSLEKAKSLKSEVSDELIAGVGKMLETKRSETLAGSIQKNWSSSFGIGKNQQISLDVPASYFQKKLQPSWMFQHQIRTAKGTATKDRYIDGEVITNPKEILSAKTGTTSQQRNVTKYMKSWKQDGWRAVSTPIVADGKILFKTQADLSVWSTDTTKNKAALRSQMLNFYRTDAVTEQLFMYSNVSHYPAARDLKFKDSFSMEYFGDPLYQSMTVYKNVAYSIEGVQYKRNSRPTRRSTGGINAWSSPRFRKRETFLQAYDLKTGKALWDKPFPETDPNGTDLKDGAVVGPPVGFNDHVLFPYLNGDEMLVIAADRLTGKINWKCSVCYLPEISPHAGTAVQIAVDQQSVFLVSGTGLMASVDVQTGKLRWARRYKRSITERVPDPNARFMGHMNQQWLNMKLHGWSHDLAMSWGPWFVVAGSDTDYLAGFRKSDGSLVWKAPRKNILGCTVDRWLGYHDGIIYATGKNSLVAYELQAEGRLFGTPRLIEGNVTGQGIITKSGIYLPVGNKIQKFDLKTLKKVSETEVELPEKMLLGSLASDGKRLWVASMHRLFALEPVAEKEETPETKTESKEEPKK